MGACMQNMLLAAHSLGLGASWQGEILNQAEEVEKLLGVPAAFELMAVLTLGYPARTDQTSSRREIRELGPECTPLATGTVRPSAAVPGSSR